MQILAKGFDLPLQILDLWVKRRLMRLIYINGGASLLALIDH
jgi:hypothetical protein